MLEVQNLSGGYAKKTDTVRGISFTVAPGSVLCVLGPNGSGKTTLFKALLRFLPLSSGCVLWNGEDVSQMTHAAFSRIMGYIPQTHTPAFSYTVCEMAMMGRASHISTFGAPGRRDEDAVLAALKTLGIAHLKDRYFTELSGGERRLALIARALCQQSKIIVMDEPSSDLDYANQQLVLHTIETLKAEGYAVILSTHASEYPFSLADRALLLCGGRVVACGPPEEALTADTLTEAFCVPMDVIEVADKSGKIRKLCLPV